MSRVVAAIGAAGVICVGAAMGSAHAQSATPAGQAPAGQSMAKAATGTPKPRPDAVRPPGVEIGVASVYCFRNGPTASGERSRPAVLTAAHKTLPFGTLVEVTNQKNGRSIVVRINDRGPFVAGRVIDLTPAAARALKFDGLADVTLRVLDHRRDSQLVARAL